MLLSKFSPFFSDLRGREREDRKRKRCAYLRFKAVGRRCGDWISAVNFRSKGPGRARPLSERRRAFFLTFLLSWIKGFVFSIVKISPFKAYRVIVVSQSFNSLDKREDVMLIIEFIFLFTSLLLYNIRLITLT